VADRIFLWVVFSRVAGLRDRRESVLLGRQKRAAFKEVTPL
jgi:hypothetical protein